MSEEYGIAIEEMEATIDHVHLLVSFPRKFSTGEVVRIIKNLSARKLQGPMIKTKYSKERRLI